ncbi:B12-binding domain-containing radical SAM protein [Prosthecochloris sp. SCSIO W1103]|uniref:B12-binding domain-containing radical SAM protein n=1 Tax=Prosthecochloris sp. SCSIO W1103 TaxID=2992244 RepID=UPI00223E087F|nr:radical SAM protein [Prosthecochloris sp. SCSIO W1103]UZJ38420.1 B12-binding domain-containing radical SAM protein [Prosthecochloris sp. SCSIO W1103]
MKKRLVLIKPPEISRFNFGTFSLAVLAAAVRHIADVTLIDATSLTCDEAIKKVLDESPDIVGITVMSQESVKSACSFVSSLKTDTENTPAQPTIIAGGHGASINPEPLLAAGASAIVYGEGEKTLLQVIENGIVPGTKGIICYGNSGTIKGKPQQPVLPLDCLEKPARDLMPDPEGVFLLETSRGCPHSCKFCETTRFSGKRWRPFSPSRVVGEIRELVEEYGAWIIHLADDNFAADPERVLNICKELQKGPLPAIILASARADDLLAHPSLLKEMSDARIRRITVGIETLDPSAAKKAGKAISLDTYREVFRKMRAYDIFSIASFIVGLPGETPVARQKNIAFALFAAPDTAHFLPFLPLPGTPYAKGRTIGLPDPEDVRDSAVFNNTFRKHHTTVTRLKRAVGKGGIRGLFAEKVLQKSKEHIPYP